MTTIAPATAPETFTFASDVRPLASVQITRGIAVALPPRPTTIRWWTEATSVVLAAIHRMFPTSTPDARPARRHYPKRYVFLEHSCLAREMDRL